MDAGTPRELTPAIRALCSELAADSEPAYLDVSPAEGARDLDCFPVVEAHVRNVGGDVVYGWRIWELPWTYIGAEFHAVWRSPGGDLIDITPAPRNEGS